MLLRLLRAKGRLYNLKLLLLILIPFIMLVLLYAKSEALSYAAIAVDYQQAHGRITEVTPNRYNPAVVDVHYEFVDNARAPRSGLYRVSKSHQSASLDVGASLDVVYSGVFHSYSLRAGQYKANRLSFIIFVVSALLLLADIIAVIWLIIKIELNKKVS